MLNTATSLISDVIGDDADNSAFVYGCYSFFERCTNGFLICDFISKYSKDETALRYLFSSVPTLCSILCFTLAWIGFKFYSDKLTKISDTTSINVVDNFNKDTQRINFRKLSIDSSFR